MNSNDTSKTLPVVEESNGGLTRTSIPSTILVQTVRASESVAYRRTVLRMEERGG